MPSRVAISAVGPSVGEREIPDERSMARDAQAPVADTSPGVPNPTLRLDTALGIVVIEFVGKSHQVVSSIPTQQQLEAYRAGAATPPGQPARMERSLQPQDS